LKTQLNQHLVVVLSPNPMDGNPLLHLLHSHHTAS
jgi:hypothetical protein